MVPMDGCRVKYSFQLNVECESVEWWINALRLSVVFDLEIRLLEIDKIMLIVEAYHIICAMDLRLEFRVWCWLSSEIRELGAIN